MIRNPEVQKRAQAEIDAVVGTDRLPNFDDRKSLPYVEAVFREVGVFDSNLPKHELTCHTDDALQAGISSWFVIFLVLIPVLISS